MRRLAIVFAATMMGSLLLPVVVSASAPTFKLTLAPVRLVVPLGTTRASFLLVNSGSEDVTIDVSSPDGWLIPQEARFSLPAGQRHTTTALIRIPAQHDAGDHDTLMTFATPPTQQGTLNVTRALATVVIIETSGQVRHGLSWDQLRVPSVVDPMAGPVLLSVRATNRGDVHETLDPVLADVENWPWGRLTGQNDTIIRFSPTILLRDSSRTLRARWQPPLLPCWCLIGVRGLSQSVIVFPLRGALGVLVILLGLTLLVRLLRKPRH